MERSRSSSNLGSLLLDPAEAEGLEAHARTEAAVLVPMHGWPRNPGLVFTERRSDLSRHAGEISFPGGRRDQGEELLDTALREAEEEIGLSRDRVEVAGALAPIGTFVTSYKVHPFVGLIEEGLPFVPNPSEVESVLIAFSTAPTMLRSQTWTVSMRGSGAPTVPTWASGISVP